MRSAAGTKRTTTLVTSSRMPFAVQAIRKLGEAGHAVVAADTFGSAPGSHSRHVRAAVITPSPTEAPCAYVDAIAAAIRAHRIERLIPTFEEVFYLAHERERLAGLCALSFADFATLARLHDKVAFGELGRELGLRVPRRRVVESQAALAEAVRELDDGFFARPAFSRGGLDLYTDRGPRGGALDLEACAPTPENPWLVEPYLGGEDRCSYAIAQRGRLVAHVAYVHPLTADGAGGVAFASIRDPEMTRACAQIVEATGYHGQLALDFMRTEGGDLVLIECNPRATAGLAMMPASIFAAAIGDRPLPRPWEAPAGLRRKITTGILCEMARDLRRIPAGLRAIAGGGEDLYATADDPLPGVYQLLSYVHVLRYRSKPDARPARSKLTAAYLHDLRWDGEPIQCPAT